MPRVVVIEVSDWLIEQTEDLRINLGGSKIPCRSGKQLGSLYVGCESPGLTFDYLPRELLQRSLTSVTFLVSLSWTSGRATVMGGRRSSVARPCEASATTLPSSTRATVSMPASGVSRTVRSEVYTRTIVFTRVSRDGNDSNQH